MDSRTHGLVSIIPRALRFYDQYGARASYLAFRSWLRRRATPRPSYRAILRLFPDSFSESEHPPRTGPEWKEEIDSVVLGASRRLLRALDLPAEDPNFVRAMKATWGSRYYAVVEDLLRIDEFMSKRGNGVAYPVLYASRLGETANSDHRKRILFITSNFPGMEHGGGNRVQNFIKILSETHDVYLCTAYFPEEDEAQLQALAPYCSSILKVPRWSFGGNQAEIRRWLGSTAMDIVHYEWPHALKNYDSTYGRLQIFTYMEVVSLSLKMEMEGLEAFSAPWLERLAELLNALRIEMVDAAPMQARIAVTTKDAEFLRRLYPYQEYAVLNHGITMADFGLPDIEPDPHTLVYVGNFRHHPNLDAMELFFEEVWPKVLRAIPDACIHVVGADPPRGIVRQSDGRHVIVTGFVDDIRPFIQRASIGIAPLISGAGLRGKVLEYAALRRTFVATSIATADLTLRDGVDYYKADDPSKFVEGIVTLLRDPAKMQRMGENAYGLVLQNYDNRRLTQQLTRLYDHWEARPGC